MATQGSYPHPVIGHLDDVNSAFELSTATVTPTTEDIEIRLRLRLDDPDLRRMLDDHSAALVFRWSCAATLAMGVLHPYVGARHVDGETWVATIDQQEVRDTVQVDVSAIAVHPIDAYALERQHPDYGGQTFTIRAGDVIAVAGSFDFEAEKLYDPLRPPLGSCFRFTDDPDQRRGLEVKFFDDDQVVVSMSPQMRASLQQLSDQPDSQVALVVLPPLMQTLSYIRDNEMSHDEDTTSKRWYATILELANKAGGLDEQLIGLAQRILEFPIDKAVQTRLPLEEDDE